MGGEPVHRQAASTTFRINRSCNIMGLFRSQAAGETVSMTSAGLPHITKPDGFLDLGPVDVAELVARVRAIPEQVWIEQNARKENAMPVFAQTRHIILRFIPGNTDALVHYSKPLWP